MKNSVLYKVYLGRLVPLMILYIVMIFIAAEEIIFHYNGESLIYILMLAMTGAVSMYMMRSTKDHNFINALPVTKKQQWKSMYLALITMTLIVYALYILVTFFRLKNNINTFSEIFISGLVKGCTAVLVLNFVLWFFSHIDFRFPVKFVIGLVIIIFGLWSVGDLILKAFNTGKNNFVDALITYWKLMTIPKGAFLAPLEDIVGLKYIEIYKNIVEQKYMVTAIYLGIITPISILLGVLAQKNYTILDFSKNPKKGNIKNFSPIAVFLFVMIAAMCLFSKAADIVDRSRLDIYTTQDAFYAGPIYDSYDENKESDMLLAMKNNEIYYVGVKYQNFSDNYAHNYCSYDIDFPEDYMYIFIAGVVCSALAGALAVGVPHFIGKKKGEAE